MPELQKRRNGAGVLLYGVYHCPNR